jgi:hypothetical protein
MKKLLLTTLLCLSVAFAFADIRGEDIIKFVKNQKKVKEYTTLIETNKMSTPCIYIEDIIKNNKGIFVIIYVGEYFPNEERQVRMTRYYFDIQTELLYESNLIDGSLSLIGKYNP